LMTWLAVIIGTCVRSVILVYASWLFAFIANLFL